jgi:hypothetical protein
MCICVYIIYTISNIISKAISCITNVFLDSPEGVNISEFCISIYLTEYHYHYQGKKLGKSKVISLDEDNENHSISYIRVNIEDAGIGLSKAARDNLFIPFKQVYRHGD